MTRLGLLSSVVGLSMVLPVSLVWAQDTITITSPSAGDVWEVGSTQQITWTTNLTNVAIRYSTDGGATWELVEDTVDNTMDGWLDFAWQVPDTPSAECVVHIEGYLAGEAPTDSGTFEIKAASDPGPDTEGGFCASFGGTSGAAAGFVLLGVALLRIRRR